MRNFTVLLLLMYSFSTLQAQSVREKILLNADWRFALGHAGNTEKDFNYGRTLSFSKINFLQESTLLEADQESRLSIPHLQKYDDSSWEKISLPHDWGMRMGYAKDQFKLKGYRKLGGRSPENSIGWYRKTFAPKLIKGCRYTLEFEGIFRDAQVWMNGIYLGKGESGYVPLVFDITECLNYDVDAVNVITVRVDAMHSELWSYEGAGIYRNVWLIRTASVHVPQWGTYVSCEVDTVKKQAKVKALIEVHNASLDDASVEIYNTVLDAKGNRITNEKTSLAVESLETNQAETRMVVTNPHLWSLDSPTLYTLQTDVLRDGRLVDRYHTSFGIRTIRFDADEGFFLNGKRVQIQGVCCHQDHAGVGVAVPDRLNQWRIERLKTFGVNAYRASHNPPTESVLNACDSLGMLVMDEMRVLSASDEGLKQLQTIIRRDRNHPSIILWCLGNEEALLQGTEKGRMIIERMKSIQRKLDPTRLCTAAMNGSWGKGFTKAVDVQGSNYYKIGNLDKVHEDYPQLPCLLSEEASTLTTRGVYKTDPSKGVYQAYDREYPDWGASAQQWMKYVDQRKYISGAFIWTGFDYGGESIRHYWPGVVSHFGILDYCGFPKDAYWYYKAQWTQDPVLHVLPHWNGLGTDSVDVQIYTNMEEVELQLNGRSLGEKKVGKFEIPSWKVKYVPGKLVARGKRGKEKYSTIVQTTGEPATLLLISETGKEIRADGNDVAVVTVKVLDAKGLLVPTADNLIRFKIKNGLILGVGNGHPSSQEPDQYAISEEVKRKAFGGYVQVIVAGDCSGLPIELTAISEGLADASLLFSPR